MKSPTTALAGAFSLVAVLFCGCASPEGSNQSAAVAAPGMPLPADVTLTKDKDLQGVWVKPGFNFSGKPTLSVERTIYKAKERDNEVAMRQFAVSELQQQIVRYAGESGLFSSVTANTGASTPGATGLRLVNTIIEFEKGGGGARYFAGLYGAGQPVIRVHGELYDAANQLVMVYEAKRSGESVGARMIGAFKSDEDIAREDIKDLGMDLADFMVRAAGLTPPKR